MPSQTRKLPLVGLALVLALLLSAYTLAPNRTAAAHAQATTPEVSGATHFIQTAIGPNISGDSTFINNLATNNKPNALLFVTPNWNPGGNGGTYDNHPIGVWYDTGNNQWAIFNEDGINMPDGAAFNVLVVPKAGGSVFVQTATSSNSSGNSTFISNTATNGKPSAKLLITPNWNPSGKGGTTNNHNIGVWFATGINKWAVFNEDLTNMPIGASFNVMVGAGSSGGGKAFLQTATSSNSLLDFTLINNSLTNTDLNAVVFATQNWNPNGKGGTYNDAAIGVFYDPGFDEWGVFNQNQKSVPLQAAFNVLAFAS